MKKFFYATMCIVSLCLSGCNYDDDEVWNAINDQEERITALEEWQKTTNENIAALQAIVNGNDYITSVEEIKEGEEIIGYIINFYRQGKVTIYNGTKGEKGDKGDQGEKGDKGDQGEKGDKGDQGEKGDKGDQGEKGDKGDQGEKGDKGDQGEKGDKGDQGDMPVIGVTEGEDGRWYWTLNGEILTDPVGNPICASGKDGEDGEDGKDGQDGENGDDGKNGASAPIPQVKTENGEVYLSVDGGTTWYKISVTTTTSGDSFIESVVDNGAHYTFNFANEESIQVPKYTGLRLLYLEGNDEEGWSEKDILNGRVEATAGEDFTIQCYYLPEYAMSYKIVEGKDDWEIERIDFGEITDLRFKGVSEAEPTTIIFSLVAADNSATFYQVTLTVSEKEEEGEDTEQVAVIPETENSELVSLLENLGIGEKDAEGNLNLTQRDIDETTSLDLSNKNLNALEGLEVFTNLTELNCSNNPLTSLDVSAFTELEMLDCSNCFNRSSVSRSYSNGVLDLSANTKLRTLSCSENGLTELILPDSPLTTIYCHYNQLTSLDLSKNEELTFVNCEYNQIVEVNLSENAALADFHATGNKLTQIDLKANTQLTSLSLYDNDFITLDVSANVNLQYLSCGNNKLTALDVSKNTNLTSLSCESNRMLTLNVSANTQLEYLNCGYQRTAENYDQQLILTINEAQQTLWDNDWKHNNYNVVVSDEAVSVSGGSGSNFGNGGVY